MSAVRSDSRFEAPPRSRVEGGPSGGPSAARTSVVGAVLAATIAAISPFDVARPLDGWSELHLRPLLVTTAVLAVAMVWSGRAVLDRWLALGAGALVTGFAVASVASPEPVVGLAVTTRVAVLALVFVGAAAVSGGAKPRQILVAGVAVGTSVAGAIGLGVLVAGTEPWGGDLFVGSVSVSHQVTRLTRPFSHANVAAMYLAPAVVLLAGAVAFPAFDPDARVGRWGWVGRWRWGLSVVGLAIGSVSLSLTLSRSGLVAAVVALVALLAVLARRRSQPAPGDRDRPLGGPSLAVLVLPLVTVVGVGVLSGRWAARLGVTLGTVGVPVPATPSRPAIWGQAVDAWLADPLTGVGPGRFGVHSQSVTAPGEVAVAHAHNPVLETLATGGLVAMVGLAVFAATVIGRSWPRRPGPGLTPVPIPVPVGLSAAVVAAMLPMVVDHPLVFSSSGNLAALLGGAWCGAARSGRPR